MALVLYATEPNCDVIAFTTDRDVSPLGMKPGIKLKGVMDLIRSRPSGGTDCALPMIWALAEAQKKGHKPYDAVIVLTDNETHSERCSRHPADLIKRYRDLTGAATKLVVIGMTATTCSIADPKDLGMLDVAGINADVPLLINTFLRL
jgi:60 kDa SS-A/Ro ribonucleoprotein